MQNQNPTDQPVPSTDTQPIQIQHIPTSNAKLESISSWLISVCVHLTMVALALALAWATIPDKPEQENYKISNNLMKPLSTNASLTKSSDIKLQNQQNVRDIQTKEVSNTDTLNQLKQDTSTDLSTLFGKQGQSAGGKLKPFGHETGGGTGTGNFYDLDTGGASNIVFLVDASGSLIDSLPFVIKELKKSIAALTPEQKFTVIFFQGGQAIEPAPLGLKIATPQNKRRVSDWITIENGNVIPHGSSSPLAAIQRAIRYKPQLIFMLSDNITGQGKYEVNRNDLFNILASANKNNTMRINAIQFMYPDPLQTLATIAANHGGTYKFIKESDLGLE